MTDVLHQRVQDIIDENKIPGMEWSVAVVDNGDIANPKVDLNGHAPQIAASLGKLGVAKAFVMKYPDEDRLATEVTLEPLDIKRGEGGILRHFPEGYKLPLGEALHWSLAISDGAANSIIVRSIGGPSSVNTYLAEDGFNVTALRLLEPQNTDTTAPFLYGNTTAIEATTLMRHVLYYPPAETSLRQGNFIQGMRRYIEPGRQAPSDYLQNAIRLAGKLHLRLPRTVYDHALQRRTNPTYFPNKLAFDPEDQVFHEVAQIHDFIIAVLSKGPANKAGSHPANPVNRVLSDIGWYFGQRVST